MRYAPPALPTAGLCFGGDKCKYAHDYWLMQDKWLIINLICRHAADGALAGVIKLKAVWIVKNKENYRKEKDEQLR